MKDVTERAECKIGEATYLLVQLHEGWLVKFIDVVFSVIGELCVTYTLALLVFLRKEVALDGSGQGVKWYDDVLCISNLLKLNVRNFLVVNKCWVVSWNVTR